jgi:uncharacterized protein (DUF924 family)
MVIAPADLLAHWFDELGEPGWFSEDEALDRTLRDRYAPLWEGAIQGRLMAWEEEPRGALALAILLDQLPRNMFRGTARAFASDPQARAVAERALARDWNLAVSERERMFLYFPLGHSEDLADQDRALGLVEERMPQRGPLFLPHVRAHREVIRRFGRFPSRNAVLNRPGTPEEQAFLDADGYRALLAAQAAG